MWIRSFLILTLALSVPASRGPTQLAPALEAALAWLASAQRPDGGFSNGFSDQSDPGTTADVIAGVSAAGRDPLSWINSGQSPLDFLAAAAASGNGFSGNPGLAAKVLLAVHEVGGVPTEFGGENLVASVVDGFDPVFSLFGNGPYESGVALHALAEAGWPIPEGALEGLLATRLDDGSYAFSGDRNPGAGDSNTTAIAVLALLALGETDEVAPSLAYFRSVQNEDGGWTYQKPGAFGEETDANSTALVILALAASGEDLSTWGDPIGTLLSLQQPDGSFAFNASTPGGNLLATVQAIPALAAASRQPVRPTPTPSSTPVPPTKTSLPPGATATALPANLPSAAPGVAEGMVLAIIALTITLGTALWLGRRGSDGGP